MKRATAMTRHQGVEVKRPRAATSLQSDRVWVQVIADDGSWGLGRTAFGLPVAAIVDEIFDPLLVGREAGAIEFHNDLMWRSSLRAGADGHAALARSAVDLALWDLKGKQFEVPVYELLGGRVRESIPCYATCDDLDWAKELGFASFKISNESHHDEGAEGLHKAKEKVSQARELVGSGCDLMVNAIMPFNVEYSVRLAETLRPYDLRWLEEPLQPWDIEGLVELRKRIPYMPIATGEDHHGRHAFRELVERRAADILQPDIEWCGGLTEAVKIHTVAESAGIDVVPHVGANTPWGQHFGVSMISSSSAEFWLGSDPGIPLEEVDRIPGTAMPIAGQVQPGSKPGFGLEIEQDWIEPYF